MNTPNETPGHPLSEAAAVEMWDASPCPEGYEFRGMLTVEQDATVYAMRAAFDAGREHERTTNTAADADRPWEPLNGGRVYVGDEVRQDRGGLTITGVVGHVDGSGDPWTAEGAFIGLLDIGTWYVRRRVQELPEWTGAIIEGAGGGRIQATAEGVTYTAAEAIYRDGMWYGAWRTARGGAGIQFSSSSITPGTWKVADQ